ncbi:hypothetical protein DSM106972_087080 [Dulcicalothrix desertica PCC 7102]|uniref:Uncharacterized protein n=1 Tax=Dulcicalothrix desertica PCC 7102 TaxID=232991 RepID=A0A3S1C752_9CYAN|nr:hypothetical protein [Dulcicalothrix desertica]RUS96521.1 hypothetical protein DSM106972_087080 [Dulcicalothrix desertica PCC 7102]TWH51366.1 hypothetical protein CAL7102_05773 [Dulcicalothrix desertica PCC 7102]
MNFLQQIKFTVRLPKRNLSAWYKAYGAVSTQKLTVIYDCNSQLRINRYIFLVNYIILTIDGQMQARTNNAI